MRATARILLVTTMAAAAAALVIPAALATPHAAGWRHVPSPDYPKQFNGLAAVFADAPHDAWAVGDHGKGDPAPIYPTAEHWTGSAWAIVPTAAVVTRGVSQFWAVGGTGPADIWAVGNTGKFNKAGTSLIEHWNGTAWTRQPVATGEPPGASLQSVSADSPNDAWAAGSANPGGGVGYSPLIEHFDGTGWHVVSAVTTGVTGLTSIDAVSPADVWVLGWYDVTVTRHTPVIEHFNGHTWVKITPPHGGLSNTLQAISGTSADDIWAVGATASNTTLTEHWNGTRWSVVPSPNGPGTSALVSVTALAPGDVWAAGVTGDEGEQPLTEHWNGTTWAITTTPGPGSAPSISSISGLAHGPVFAAGTTRANNPPYQAKTLILQH